MKKKFAVLFMAAILAFSAAACSGSSENAESVPSTQTSSAASVESSYQGSTESSSEESSASEIDAKDLIQKKFIDPMKDGKFYVKMTMDTASLGASSETSGIPESITMVIAADSENSKMYVDMGLSMMGFNKIIVADGKQWMISDETKTAYYQETTADIDSQLNSFTSGTFNTDGIEYVSDSEVEFNGKKCIAVVYNVASDIESAANESSTATTTSEQTYYFDKDTQNVVGIKVNAAGKDAEIIIDEFTSELPSNLFDIPSDYTQTELQQLTSTTTQ